MRARSVEPRACSLSTKPASGRWVRNGCINGTLNALRLCLRGAQAMLVDVIAPSFAEAPFPQKVVKCVTDDVKEGLKLTMNFLLFVFIHLAFFSPFHDLSREGKPPDYQQALRSRP